MPASRADADRVLDTMPPDTDVAALGDLRAEILLDETLACLGDHARPRRGRALAHDAAHGTDLAASVLAWLDALGDVRAAAARLTVHPNTLRYRAAAGVGGRGAAPGRPAARVVHHLQLLRAART